MKAKRISQTLLTLVAALALASFGCKKDEGKGEGKEGDKSAEKGGDKGKGKSGSSGLWQCRLAGQSQ